ncbi:MAG: LamG domain-containing protein [Nannocystaceae bacterium]|nr:LamG domain-containing protein [bacterium]
MGVRAVAATWLVLSVACAPLTQPFTCTEDGQCDGGQCEANGYCSFPSADCESGSKYGSLSPLELANMCVPVMGSTGTVDPTGAMTNSTRGESSSSETTEGPSSTGPQTSLGSSTTGSSTGIGPATSDTSTGSDSSDTNQPTADLRVWYRMDDPPDDGVLDDGPLGLDGSCLPTVECPNLEPASPSGGAYEFENAMFQHPHDDAFELDALTIAAFVRWNGSGPLPQQVIAKPVGVGILNSWQLQFTTYMGEDSLQFVVGDDAVVDSIYIPAPPNEWMHVAVTYDGSVARGYLGGDEVVSEQLDVTIGYDESPLIVGADRNFGDTFTLFLDGSIADLRLYGEVLSGEEIAALAAEFE